MSKQSNQKDLHEARIIEEFQAWYGACKIGPDQNEMPFSELHKALLGTRLVPYNMAAYSQFFAESFEFKAICRRAPLNQYNLLNTTLDLAIIIKILLQLHPQTDAASFESFERLRALDARCKAFDNSFEPLLEWDAFTFQSSPANPLDQSASFLERGLGLMESLNHEGTVRSADYNQWRRDLARAHMQVNGSYFLPELMRQDIEDPSVNDELDKFATRAQKMTNAVVALHQGLDADVQNFLVENYQATTGGEFSLLAYQYPKALYQLDGTRVSYHRRLASFVLQVSNDDEDTERYFIRHQGQVKEVSSKIAEQVALLDVNTRVKDYQPMVVLDYSYQLDSEGPTPSRPRVELKIKHNECLQYCGQRALDDAALRIDIDAQKPNPALQLLYEINTLMREGLSIASNPSSKDALKFTARQKQRLLINDVLNQLSRIELNTSQEELLNKLYFEICLPLCAVMTNYEPADRSDAKLASQKSLQLSRLAYACEDCYEGLRSQESIWRQKLFSFFQKLASMLSFNIQAHFLFSRSRRKHMALFSKHATSLHLASASYKVDEEIMSPIPIVATQNPPSPSALSNQASGGSIAQPRSPVNPEDSYVFVNLKPGANVESASEHPADEPSQDPRSLEFLDEPKLSPRFS